ncbi:MAG TPA: PAS domain S-box protein [Puia sp.]|nr:PAS domain S-box protein [Puia sp.]
MKLTHSVAKPEPASRVQMLLCNWSKYFAITILVIVILVLIGWQWDIVFFKRPIPDFTPMSPLTATAFLLVGASFLALSPTRPSNGRSQFVARILAVLVLLIGLLKITGPAILSNQMTAQTAFCFIPSGLALLFLNRETPGGQLPSQYFAMPIFMVGLFSLLGYLYRVHAFSGAFTYTPMALHTAACFFFLSAAILLANPGKGIMKELTSSNIGGLTSLSLLPLVILLPIVLGYLRLVAYWEGIISTEFGVDSLVSAIILAFTVIVWYNARLLNKRDELKKATEHSLQESEERFRLLVDSVRDYAIFMLDPFGKIVSWNEGAERIKGYKKEEIVGRDMSIFYTPEAILQGEPGYNLSQARNNGRFEREGWRMRKDGSIFWANVVFSAIHDSKGEILGYTKVTCDNTEKKRATEQIAYMARLMEDTSDAIFSTDHSFVIRTWNKAAELLFGYTLSEVRGLSAGDVLRTQLDMEFRDAIREKMGVEGYWKGEVSYLKKNGSQVTVLLSASAVRDAEGELDGFVMVCRDISERKKMELQLHQFNRELEQQVSKKTAELTGIFERITDAFIAMDKNLCYTYLNKKAGELIHRDPASLIGKWVWDVFPDAIGSPTYLAFNKAMEEQRNMTNTDYYAPLDLWQENHLYPSPDGLSVFIRNVTEEKRREKKITDYKYALDQSSIVSITDEKGIIKYVNDNFCQVSKYTAAELIGQNHRIVGSNYHPAAFISNMWETISNGKVWNGEFRNRAKDGSIYWVDMTIVPFLNDRNEPYEYLELDSDITERKNAEALLAQSYQDIRQLAAHLQDIREEERTAIAREIHDELGQQLTGLKMDLSWIGKRKIVQEDIEVRQKVLTVMNLLDSTIKTVRRIATDLRPSILDDLGLIAAIEWQSQEFEKRSGISTTFVSTIDECKYSSVISIGLFRICQETLTNVARHANASKIRISLQEREDANILLKIEDDGKGFEVGKIGAKKTLGLLGMKERTLMMGGQFRMDSHPGKGTTLSVTVPLKTT